MAVDDYGDQDSEHSHGVQEQLRAAHDWWAASSLGDRRFTPHRATPLHDRDDVEAFLRTTGLREAPADDVLVLYITGHGVKGTGGSHFLQLPSTDPQRLLTTAYRTVDLVLAALDSHAQHVLVIVNTCHAGRVQVELTAAAEEITLRRRRSAHLSVMATADAAEPVAVRDMAVLLDRVQEQLRTTAGITGPHLTVEEFRTELDRAAHRHPHAPLNTPLVLTPWGRPGRPTWSLPNPGYRPSEDLVAPARRQLAAHRGEIDPWISRASGRTDDADPGWYFSGRADISRQLTGFLSDPVPGTMIVTGAAGSGKSAVIARAVTLADPGFRENPLYRRAIAEAPDGTVPPPDSVDAAVHARNKDANRITADLIAALGHEPDDSDGSDRAEALRRQLRRIVTHRSVAGRSTSPITLVIDGFDEAVAPYALVPHLITPLAELTAPEATPGLRLVIGVRSTFSTPASADRPQSAVDGRRTPSLLRLLSASLRGASRCDPAVIRTDGTSGSTTDIAAYLDALLTPALGAGSEVAGVIALRTTPSFLDARIAAEQLRRSTDPAALARSPEWLALLQQGTLGLLRQDLADVADTDLPAETALALLRAAAFAPGAGIPWADIWPAVAEAVLGRHMPDPDTAITRLLEGRLAGYLTQDTEDGRTVYRPLHERLTEVLRTRPEEFRPPSPPPKAPVPGAPQ